MREEVQKFIWDTYFSIETHISHVMSKAVKLKAL